ncbi:23S rRNA pseudouridine2605 synthase [Chitinophaga niastensis]|uniref:Pseudouridine synthase n=1 Tax=Chitinophaga niastensis TaxID=536980 RepID=A0A2P8HRK1_CHINA|nr:pseudouridine synthase [Chitinophaga niastensis]PSL48828.1 23S rRNA pseudouridine2605 synthase [Chitinophaga niastensis]
MKKKQPAKKGSRPFKENKFGKSDKPAGNRNRSSADGERPGRASAKDNRTGDDRPSSRKPRFDGERTGDDKPSFRKRTFGGDDKPERKRSFGTDRNSDDKAERKRSFGDDDKPERKRTFGADRNNDDKPAFRKRSFGADGKPERKRGSGTDNLGNDKPVRAKRTFGGDKNSDDKPERKRSFGGEVKPAHKRSFGGDRNADRNSDDKPAFRKRSFGGDDKPERKRSFGADRNSDDKPGFRKRSTGNDSRGEDKPDGKRAFSAFRRDGERPERTRSFDKEDNGGEKAPRKRTFGGDRKGPGKKSDDNSAFHFHGEGRKGDKSAQRDTPSGFNRKKFFDKTNERFADKQDRKKGGKTRDTNDNEHTNNKESKESIFGPGEMPLNKYVAHCGLCSRRKAVDLIKEGKVTVNGKVVTEPATKVTGDDVVTMHEKKINLTKNLVYILLNKPKGYITTTDDPEGRKTVMDLIQDATTENERVYPVGRLDRNTSGLLLLTNDGELAQHLSHPKHKCKKIYQVELDKPLTKGDFEKIVEGVTLEDGVAFVDALGYVDPKDKKQVGIEIHSGKNRIVRRIFEHLEYTVEKLDRVMYAGLTKKTLNRGQWRFLSEKEVILLKHFKK